MQSQTTEEFAATRIRAILAQIKLLQHELAVLRKLKQSFTPEAKLEVLGVNTPRRSGGVTFQDMIVDVLNDQPSHGTDALKIIDLIAKKHGKKILRSSISPQLSRLKNNGVLTLADNVWTLTEKYRAKKQETPVVGVSDGVDAPFNDSGEIQKQDDPFEEEIPF